MVADLFLRQQAAPTSFERIGSAGGFTGVPGLAGGGFGAGFERLTSVPYALGGAGGDGFSRLASLGNFAAPASSIARLPSAGGNIPNAAAAEAFNRAAAATFIPFQNPAFERVGSYSGSGGASAPLHEQHGGDAHGASHSSPRCVHARAPPASGG